MPEPHSRLGLSAFTTDSELTPVATLVAIGLGIVVGMTLGAIVLFSILAR